MLQLIRSLLDKYYYTEARLAPKLSHHAAIVISALDNENGELPYPLRNAVSVMAQTGTDIDRFLLARAEERHKKRVLEAQILRDMATDWGRDCKPTPTDALTTNKYLVANADLVQARNRMFRDGYDGNSMFGNPNNPGNAPWGMR